MSLKPYAIEDKVLFFLTPQSGLCDALNPAKLLQSFRALNPVPYTFPL